MASQSRRAQERLNELEKLDAPFGEQVEEGLKFIGVDEGVIERCANGGPAERKQRIRVYYGREEWLLRWLLKRMQSVGYAVPRRTSEAWKLLCYLVKVLPQAMGAKVLVERDFVSILRLTLEEALKASEIKDGEQTAIPPEEKSEKSSKKRKHTGELVAKPSTARIEGLPNFMAAIFSTMNWMVESSKLVSGQSEQGGSAAFSAEYTKTVIRTTARDSAIILGSWLSLCHVAVGLSKGPAKKNIKTWLSPFVEIWDTRAADDTHLMQFSVHCTGPLLALLRLIKNGGLLNPEWEAQLEQLVSHNIMNPARAAKLADAGSDLLATLTRVSVLQETGNAPVLFEVAIRSIQPHKSQRRRQNDDTWLQNAFDTLRDPMQQQAVDKNRKVICAMLQSAIDYKFGLELSVLRKITRDFALSDTATSDFEYRDKVEHTAKDAIATPSPKSRETWKLLAIIINLDANVFLIPNDEKDLLKELLKRITKVSEDMHWPLLSDQVVSTVAVPLMNEFAKARDLSGFIRHWYSQQVENEKGHRKGLISQEFSAWENEALQTELSKLMEASLTVQQITQAIEWLSDEVENSPESVGVYPASVILDAIAGSVSREEVVDAVGLRPFQIIFHHLKSASLESPTPCISRFWRIISKTLNWLVAPDLSQMLMALELPHFRDNIKAAKADGLLHDYGGVAAAYSLDYFRCVCAMWNVAKTRSQEEKIIKKELLHLLHRLAVDFGRFPTSSLLTRDGPFELDGGLCTATCGSVRNKHTIGVGWMLWSLVRCIMVEYPKVLELGLEMAEGSFKKLLREIFWVSSVGSSVAGVHESMAWFQRNSRAFPDLWQSALRCDRVLNNEALIEMMIDIMLSSQTNLSNPILISANTNLLAVESLLQLPLETVFRKNRERIMRSWLPPLEDSDRNSEGLSWKSTALDPAVLSLKIRVMQRPLFYAGMEFGELVKLADALVEAEIPQQHVNLSLLKELARVTFAFVHTNVDQPPQQAYITDAFKQIQKKLKKAAEKKKHRPNYALVAVFDVAFTAFSSKSTQLDALAIISTEDLESCCAAFTDCLLSDLKDRLQPPMKGEINQHANYLAVSSIIDALSSSGVDAAKMSKLKDDARIFAASANEKELNIKGRLGTFMAIHTTRLREDNVAIFLNGDIATISGRTSIVKMTNAAVEGKDRKGRLEVLESLIGDEISDGIQQLDKLLAIRTLIYGLEDKRKSIAEAEQEKDEEKDKAFDLSAAYSRLCYQLWKISSTRQFYLLSETLHMMLQQKARSLSQFNIDMTLGVVSIICSRKGPSLDPARSGTIFTHICKLLQAVLTHHRLKLQGHFHLIVQVLQAVIRCLFTPLPHSTNKPSKSFGAPPPWISSRYPLSAPHAALFTRLITLISDPSISSLRGSQKNALTSATEKAKRMAGQHMQYLLMLYIRLQLEMRTLPENRTKMLPGVYAMFDTTTPESRKVMSDALDASGRAVFGTLYRDYQRFGKWRGN